MNFCDKREGYQNPADVIFEWSLLHPLPLRPRRKITALGGGAVSVRLPTPLLSVFAGTLLRLARVGRVSLTVGEGGAPREADREVECADPTLLVFGFHDHVVSHPRRRLLFRGRLILRAAGSVFWCDGARLALGLRVARVRTPARFPVSSKGASRYFKKFEAFSHVTVRIMLTEKASH